MGQTAGQKVKELVNAGDDLVTADFDKLAGVTATATEINLLASAGAAVASGTQAAVITDIAITYTSNDPTITPNGAVTIADGSAATVAELLELAEELIAKQNAIIDALQAFGIVASA
jgi:hypothetical protein